MYITATLKMNSRILLKILELQYLFMSLHSNGQVLSELLNANKNFKKARENVYRANNPEKFKNTGRAFFTRCIDKCVLYQ